MKIKIPTKCPSCNSELIRKKDQLYCINVNCSEKRKKVVSKFCSTLKIKGLGEKTLEKLEIQSILDIYLLDNALIIEKLGEKLGTKLINEIEHSKVQPLSILLAALSIPSIGKATGEKIEAVVSKLEDINEESCKKAALGPVATNNLLNYLKNNTWIYSLPIKISNTITKVNKKNINVVITGKLKDFSSREIAKQYLKSLGIDVKSSVSKNTNYVICDIENQKSSTITKANQYNIPVITMEQFKEIINDN